MSPLAVDGCASPVTADAFIARIQDVDDAFVRLDREDVAQSHLSTLEMVPCLAEIVPRSDVARLHRSHGLALWLRDRDPNFDDAFAAARSADPTLAWTTRLTPSGHPLQIAWDAVPAPTEPFALAPPERAFVWVDGVLDAGRIPDRPALVQVTDAKRVVRWSRYVEAGTPVTFEGLPSDLPPLEPGPWAKRHFRHATGPLLIGGSVSAAFGAGSLAYASGWRKAFDDRTAERSEAELAEIRTRVNTAGDVSGVSGALASGLFMAAACTIRW